MQIEATQKRQDFEEVRMRGSNVLMLHGMQQDAQSWLTGYFVGTPLPLKLADDGFTVFMANSRGTKYS